MSAVSLAVVLTVSSCSRHYSKSMESSKLVMAVAHSIDTIAKGYVADSLIGSWKLSKVESPTVTEKMTTYASQVERDDLSEKLKNAQAAFAGLYCTFNKDMSYTSLYAGQTDLGTWRVTKRGEIETMSRINSDATSFKIVSLDSRTLRVSVESSGVVLVLTLLKQ
jgi:hypothetical protein